MKNQKDYVHIGFARACLLCRIANSTGITAGHRPPRHQLPRRDSVKTVEMTTARPRTLMRLTSNTSGRENTAHGWHALSANTTGTGNTADGSYALSSNTTGWNNTAIGDYSLWANTGGWSNSAFGGGALNRNTNRFPKCSGGHRRPRI